MSDEHIFEAFEAVNIPKMQTKVYLDLLKNKESTATQVSKRTKMHRANVYDTLTKLKERNLVYLSNKEGKQVFAALSTDLIINEEKEKLENLKLAMSYIKTTYIPGDTPKVYTLEGLNAVKSILFGILEKKSDIWMYGLAENESIINLLNDKFMHSFHIERKSQALGKSVIPIMTYGKYIVYLKADSSNLPNIPLSKFNYTSGTFEKKWGPEHKTIVLTPNHSSIRKVEIEIQGIDIRNMKLLPDKSGDVIEDMAKVKITRHYRFSEGDSENKRDSSSASPGEKKAR